MLKFFAAAVLIASFPGAAEAELLPPSRLTDWTPGTNVGVPGGIPSNRSALIDVTLPPYNADRSGATNAAPAIQNAINNAPKGAVVYMPAGSYRVDSTLTIGPSKDGITLRGAGPEATKLLTTAPTGIFVGSSSDYRWNWPSSGNVVTGPRTKGAATLTLGNTSAFSVGQMVQIKVADQLSESAIQGGAAPVIHVSSWTENRRMKARVVAKTDTTLTIFPGLYFDCSNLTTTVNVAQAQTDSVGLEDFGLDCISTATIMGVELEQCYGSWIKNVKVNNAANYAFFLYDALNCEIRESYANRRSGAGTNGAGILCNTSSACLIEDNIVYKFFPLIEVNHGASGNVIAYNLFEDSRVYGVLGAGIDTNHGPHNSYNLYEGNITPNVQSDGFFGSASEDTLFRNWIHGTVYDRSATGFLVSLNRFTRNYSLIGNIIGSSTTNTATPYTFGNPNMGNSSSIGTAQGTAAHLWADWTRLKTSAPGAGPGPAGYQERDLDVESTVILKGNYNVKTASVPASESLNGDVLPPSLYLPGKPAWFGNLPWPAFGPATPNAQYESIPAGRRFLQGTVPVAQTAPPPPQGTAPTITQHPESQAHFVGASTTITANAAGTPAPTLQWQKNGVLIPGVTGSTLYFTNLQTNNSGTYTLVATNSAGVVYSNSATLTVNAPQTPQTTAPTITQQPQSQTRTVGASTTITANATGNPAPTLQWQKNGVLIPGVTGTTLYFTNLQTNNSGTYTLVATNAAGSVYSTSATLTVTPPELPQATLPSITQQPQSQTRTVGASTTITANATGNPAPTLQWQKNGVLIPGVTGTTLYFTNLQTNNSGTYTLVATNSAGTVYSNSATLTISQPASAPIITTQPTSRSINTGASTAFNVVATGWPSPSYQWRKNGTNIAGATSASYAITNATTDNAGTYTVVVANSAGTLTSNGAVLAVALPPKSPSFTVQPTARSIMLGNAATFSALADGVPAPSYQWRKNGANISGATSASYTIASVALTDSATYTVVARNSQGTVTSENALLVVTPPLTAPVFVAQPAGGSIRAANAKTFSVSATGYPAPSYQWQKDGVNIAGATSASYIIVDASLRDAGTYTATATNSSGVATSAAAVLTVNPAAYADFDADGKSDIYLQNVETGESVLWLMSGTAYARTASQPTMPAGTEVVGYGDFNRDGKLDLLWQNPLRSEYGLVYMNGATPSSFLTLGSIDNWHVTGAGDFNGDGNADILWRNRSTGNLVICLMSGAVATSRIDLGAVGPDWEIAGTGDFNGDGKTDLLWESANRQLHCIWLLNGTSYGTWANLGGVRSGMEIAGTGDFNSDGTADILWQHKTTGLREVQLMAGTTAGTIVSLGFLDVSWKMRN